ncbi:phosphonopyruvate decarboxylase [Candidatus Geothermarchaeota archaeon ex4572_27]|nr:MAG: phosphonopyruvate decarboxylase [Candidatus Geothermarchaeota archaeon ex4572_27]
MTRLVYVVLDGAADGPRRGTCLEEASTPNLDEVAGRGLGGMHYPVGRGLAPESDAAVFGLIGYDHRRYYVGRGAVEALGVGLRLKEGFEVAFRGNLATLDYERGVIVDRRAGRDVSTEEARRLVRGLRMVDLDIHGGYAKVRVGLDYRVVVVIGSRKRRLSDMVSNTDPAYVRVGRSSVAAARYEPKPTPCRPLVDDEAAAVTAELVNRFTEVANEALRDHPVNRRRVAEGRLPANTIILRDAGMRPAGVPSVRSLYGVRLAVVAEMPTEVGIGRLVGARVRKVEYVSGRDPPGYAKRAREVAEILGEWDVDVVYVHLKGPDVFGHDGDREGKIRSIEAIDKYFMGELLNHVDLERDAVLVTSDHATPPEARGHTGDPVPLAIAGPGLERDEMASFCEREAMEKGSLGVLGYAWMIMPLVRLMLWGSARAFRRPPRAF